MTKPWFQGSLCIDPQLTIDNPQLIILNMACFHMPYVIALRTVMKGGISSAVAEQNIQVQCMCKSASSLIT